MIFSQMLSFSFFCLTTRCTAFLGSCPKKGEFAEVFDILSNIPTAQ